jgi:hypothetical protein
VLGGAGEEVLNQELWVLNHKTLVARARRVGDPVDAGGKAGVVGGTAKGQRAEVVSQSLADNGELNAIPKERYEVARPAPMAPSLGSLDSDAPLAGLGGGARGAGAARCGSPEWAKSDCGWSVR